MLARLKQSWFVWLLLICLMLVNGAMVAPSVGHAGHHGDHQAGTHSTGICAWLCAAGQGIESASVALNSSFHLIEQAIVLHVDPIPASVFSHRVSRGPPTFLA
ncbi:MAG: hypothetical protein HP495_16185 [Nitrospira sp.]|nr:hypothetical protein [Nitrospira sp.]